MNENDFHLLKAFKKNGLAPVMAIANFKGGVGKTLISNVVAAIAAYAGMKVLLIETCEQMNSSIYLHENRDIHGQEHLSVLDYMKDPDLKPSQVIAGTIIKNLHIMPAAPGMDEHFALRFSSFPMGYMTLAHKIKPLRSYYDLIIIDTAPNVGCMQTAALSASTHYTYVHAGCMSSLEGIVELDKKIGEIPKIVNPELSCIGIVHNNRKKEAVDEMVANLEDYGGIPFVVNRIPYSARVGSSSFDRKNTYWIPNIFAKKRIYQPFDVSVYKLTEELLKHVGLVSEVKEEEVAA